MNIRNQFPQLNQSNVVYLDSAASSLTPEPVLVAMDEYYRGDRANIHRGVYEWSARATAQFENARQIVARFLGCFKEEIIVTRGATDGLNMIAELLEQVVEPGQNIVLPISEHHSNMLPWRELARKQDLEIRYVELRDETIYVEDVCTLIDDQTAIVAVAQVSNVLGNILDVKSIAECAHQHGAQIVVDGCQAVAHMPVDVEELGVDWYVFSGHKVYGPTGIGIIYGDRDLLSQLRPVRTGGDMIKRVSRDSYEPAVGVARFEPGTPPIAEMIGLGVALEWIQEIGWKEIIEHEQMVVGYLLDQLRDISSVRVLGPQDRTGVVSFVVEGLDPMDLAFFLDSAGVCVRFGYHCAEPLAAELGVSGSTRVSLGVYNAKEDIDRFITELRYQLTKRI